MIEETETETPIAKIAPVMIDGIAIAMIGGERGMTTAIETGEAVQGRLSVVTETSVMIEGEKIEMTTDANGESATEETQIEMIVGTEIETAVVKIGEIATATIEEIVSVSQDENVRRIEMAHDGMREGSAIETEIETEIWIGISQAVEGAGNSILVRPARLVGKTRFGPDKDFILGALHQS